ncbi:heparinase [Leifsonia sp. LS1]|uniref:heparinase II/III domain-containing protein n=1 Tax=Leifsonia sp. LS1 TaxID=2828483 RepID=UPI001CFE175A|nr:heparinase II/III family protein [Leifsonia sp. LS1]GIT79703.1 heparinase [Leifsonia sp. LS1]
MPHLSHPTTTDDHAAGARPADGDVFSRVSAHTAPPVGTQATAEPFEGPLFAHWGDGMREPALRALLGAAGTERIQDRTGIPAASDRSVWDRLDPITLDGLAAEAEPERGLPWPGVPASLFARYARDGDRRGYEAAVDARQQRLTRAVVLAATTRGPAWIDEAADGAIVLCEQSTWSLSAHDDAGARRGFVVPDAASPYLDLVAGEIAAQLAVADRVLGTDWDAAWPGVRERIRREVEVRVFTPFETRDDLWWLGYWRDVNNWNPWILGNVLLSAALLLDDPVRIAAMIARALDSLDRYVATLPADGAIDEGVAYWWNGAGRMLELLELVAQLTDGGLDAGGVPVVAEVLRFPMRMQLGADWYVNVADGWARSRHAEPWHLPFRWGLRLGDDRVVDWARGARQPGRPIAPATGGLPRFVRAAADARWREAPPAAPPLPQSVWLPSVQVLVCRAVAGSTGGLALAAKGGTNDENHNHKDLGSFIVAAGGRPLLVDVGKPTYRRETFSPERYGIRAMQSGWHNAPAPHGLEQGEGPAFEAAVVTAPHGEPASAPGVPESVALPISLELDLTAAYPLAPGERWRRRASLVSPSRIEIRDEWRLQADAKVDDGPIATLHLVAAGEVHRSADRVVVSADGRAIAIDAAGLTPELEAWALDDPELAGVWGERLTRLSYPLADLAGSLTMTIEEIR